jgi:hypothetical protein
MRVDFRWAVDRIKHVSNVGGLYLYPTVFCTDCLRVFTNHTYITKFYFLEKIKKVCIAYYKKHFSV